jgi:hypothetical protein
MKNWSKYFNYEPVSGNLIIRERPPEDFKRLCDWAPRNKRLAGKISGAKDFRADGRPKSIRSWVDGKKYANHMIIWEMLNGPIPEGMLVDHINGNPFDNRLSNLRLATPSQNNMNAGMQKNKKVKLVGVRRTREGWTTSIMANGIRYPLGSHRTKGEAAVVYAKASLRYHGAFSPFMRKAIAVQ